MADDVNVGQVPDDSGQEPQTVPAAQGQEPEQFDTEYVKKLRSEAAEYRKKLRDLEAKVKADQDAKLSEAERLQNRLAELEREQAMYQQERQERTVRYEVMLAASRLGCVDPEAAFQLLDWASLEFEDDGKPKNVDKALADLLAKRPYLRAGQNTSTMNPAKGRGDVDDPFVAAMYRGAGLQKKG